MNKNQVREKMRKLITEYVDSATINMNNGFHIDIYFSNL